MNKVVVRFADGQVLFKDGETILGTTQGYQSGRPGFFVVPPDPESNNERCFVISRATQEIIPALVYKVDDPGNTRTSSFVFDIAAGQVIGKLGSSEDSFGPHLHYQLQSGPQLFHGQSLPFRFQNVDGPQLSRGRYFNAQ